jgi:hypothetical protein
VILYGMNATRFMRPVVDSNRFLSMLTTINFSVKKNHWDLYTNKRNSSNGRLVKLLLSIASNDSIEFLLLDCKFSYFN